MSDTTAPSHISLRRFARLYGKTGASAAYSLIVRGAARSETIAGRPVVIFASLPADKQAQYLKEEAETQK